MSYLSNVAPFRRNKPLIEEKANAEKNKGQRKTLFGRTAVSVKKKTAGKIQ
jgi:hypothetical protein